MKPVAICFATLVLATLCTAQVTTSQYDNARIGATLNEKILTPQNVNAQQFGRLGAFKVGGPVYAQPLFVPNVEIPSNGTHDILYVATEHDSVFAFDANRPGDALLWQVSFLDKARGTIPPTGDMVQCPFLNPEVGITSTPVIDIKTGTLYVLARTAIRHTMGDNEYFQHLHALAITTGVEKFGGPKLITASVPGRGAGRNNRQVDFDPLYENPRAALTLANNSVYLRWASSCDVDPYHGWVISYDPQTLAQKAVLSVNPDGSEAGICLSDTGPAVDSEGNLCVPTGNGTFDATSGARDYGDSVLKLDGSTLAVRDYFTPFDQADILAGDSDVGSSGPTLLPDQPGAHRHLLLHGESHLVFTTYSGTRHLRCRRHNFSAEPFASGMTSFSANLRIMAGGWRGIRTILSGRERNRLLISLAGLDSMIQPARTGACSTFPAVIAGLTCRLLGWRAI